MSGKKRQCPCGNPQCVEVTPVVAAKPVFDWNKPMNIDPVHVPDDKDKRIAELEAVVDKAREFDGTAQALRTHDLNAYDHWVGDEDEGRSLREAIDALDKKNK